MDTKILNVNEIDTAAELIRKGELVAFPTDTVYGLGADATNEEAVQDIFRAKGRPTNRPINVLVANHKDIYNYATDVPDEAYALVKAFWPGPFTIILKDAGKLASPITAGKQTVGMRMPDLKVARDFIEKSGVPLATPSANSSGRPSTTLASHVIDDLNGKISAIIDGGETPYGIESTILDYSNPDHPLLLRPGNISQEAIEAIIQKPVFMSESRTDASAKETEKHYEPLVPVYIVTSDWNEVIQKFQDDQIKIGLLASDDLIALYKDKVESYFSLGAKGDVAAANKKIFQGLRELEQSEAAIILAYPYPNEGIGIPYMNRLKNAASHKMI